MRIVSLLSSATEMLFALGLGEQVVAVSHECDYPALVATLPRATRSRIVASRPSVQIDAQVKAILASGEPLYKLDPELLCRLAPDLIITQAQCDVCAVRYQDVVDFVAAEPALAHCRVLALAPQSLDYVLADIRRVAQAAGCPDRGAALQAMLQQRIDAVAAQCAQAPRPRVVCLEWTQPLMAAGNWTPELIGLAGGESLLAVGGRHSPYVTWEQVRTAAPEVLLLAPCGFDLARSRAEAEALRTWPGFGDLPAVHAGRAFVIDGNAYFNRSGPRLVDSLEIAAYLIQPARVPPPVDERAEGRAWVRL
jgi:iron complex transport system substrate-binding protein